MGAKTEIAWTDATWNPVTGCTPISPGCAHCYAKGIATRFAGNKAWPNGFAVTLHPERLSIPLRWKLGRRVFVCSTGDLFHEDVPFEFIRRVWLAMEYWDHHTYQVLTKRPRRMLEFVRDYGGDCLPNVWLGVTAENQEMADERIPILLQVPAAVRFVSVEPMLGSVNLTPWLEPCDETDDEDGRRVFISEIPALDWVIAGSETGPGARSSHSDWFRSLRNHCQEAEIPFFLKQTNAQRDYLLDGREHREFPEVAAQ